MARANKLHQNYPLINSYGVISDCHSVALVSPEGSVDWGCFPDFDSPAIFCRLLDAERGGSFQIAPTESSLVGSQHYLHGSNVLQTRFASIAGEVVLTDFMPVETLNAWPWGVITHRPRISQAVIGSNRALLSFQRDATQLALQGCFRQTTRRRTCFPLRVGPSRRTET